MPEESFTSSLCGGHGEICIKVKCLPRDQASCEPLHRLRKLVLEFHLWDKGGCSRRKGFD